MMLRWMVSCLLFATSALALPRCPGDQPPADAQTLTGALKRTHSQIVQSLRDRATMGRTASSPTGCVTSRAVFLGSDWTRPEVIGPIGTHLGFGLMAYAFGAQHFLRQPRASNGGTADLRGAWHVGCAYARAGLNRGRTLYLAELLEVESGPRADHAGWLAATMRGFAACGGR